MEGRIRQLEHMLENCEIVDDQQMYTVVYEGDTDDMAEKYVIGNMEEQVDGADVVSAASPLGAALSNSSEGDTVSYDAPNGAITITVLKVEPV
jgi:transcription elongation factor GreA